MQSYPENYRIRCEQGLNTERDHETFIASSFADYCESEWQSYHSKGPIVIQLGVNISTVRYRV